jgi:hypothetical protein
MAVYYSYLNNINQQSVVTTNHWNALVGANQATDDLLIGSLYPYARLAMSSFYTEKNSASSFIRYYTPIGTFKNSNNQDATIAHTIQQTSWTYTAHQILLPGFYAWNIVWGENRDNRLDDQVMSIQVKKITQSQINTSLDPALAEVIGEFRTITTSWAYPANDRYSHFNMPNDRGMGYPLYNYSGINYFNAPPYSNEYEYIVFEFSSSPIVKSGPILTYFTDIYHPSITLMKVR